MACLRPPQWHTDRRRQQVLPDPERRHLRYGCAEEWDHDGPAARLEPHWTAVGKTVRRHDARRLALVDRWWAPSVGAVPTAHDAAGHCRREVSTDVQ
ncbi:hypothetical protein VTK73DRAFT_4539 [Phialemonium thermophilum]|uniref:Uncharacterized protein n=1 Tax=Phialemonium thermophilum TaxID=223376 RepID=A0ABR3V7N5_9PEZI